MAAYSIGAAARQLDMPESTVWKWTRRMGLGFKTANGSFRLTEDDLEKLKVTRALREEGHDFAVIRQRLKAVAAPEGARARVRRSRDSEPTVVFPTHCNHGEVYGDGRERAGRLLARVKSLQERLAEALRRHHNDCQLLTEGMHLPGGTA